MKNLIFKIKNLLLNLKDSLRFKRMLRAAACAVSIILVLVLCAASALTNTQKPVLLSEETTKETEEETEKETETAQTETAAEEIIALSLSATSAQRDLKVKIYNQDNELAQGEVFEISVAPADNEDDAASYSDEDEDGIIYISSIEAGEYIVTLSQLEGYEISEASITVTVKDQIEYEVVDVTDEIKTEDEVNVAKEDASSKTSSSSSSASSSSSSAASEAAESTMTVRAVSKSDVDTSSFPTAQTGLSVSSEITSGLTVSVPSEVLLYNSPLSEAFSAEISAQIEGDTSLIASYSWESSDESTVSVSGDGLNAVITRVSDGSAVVSFEITLTSLETYSLSCTVTVSEYTDDTQLTDTSGNLLYLDEQALTPALVSDYMNYDVFYMTPLYTGWQTINGKLYYFDENSEPACGIQIIDGVIYTFASDGSVTASGGYAGIDVSKWNGTIDWDAVADAGIDFVIIRVGYRGYSTGVLVEDSCFSDNISGAAAAGLKVGVYFFTQAITEAEAVEEASMAVSLVSGYSLTYPIFIDTESSGGRADSLTVSERTAIVSAFCRTVENAGYKAGVYASKSWYDNQLTASSLSSYYIWVAQYADECTYSGDYDIWQYSSSGSINGISTRVDLDISYTDF